MLSGVKRLVAVGAVLSALGGCAPSEEEVMAEFDEFLATRVACDAVDDCVLVFPGCPLGCAVGVNRGAAGEVEQKAEELIADYESGGRSCDYECLQLEPACEAGRCEAVPVESQ
jgi:hypothetical protein